VETGDRSGVPEMGAGNGFQAWSSPRFGLETERSGGARDRTDSRLFSGVEAKVQARNVDLAMVAEASL